VPAAKFVTSLAVLIALICAAAQPVRASAPRPAPVNLDRDAKPEKIRVKRLHGRVAVVVVDGRRVRALSPRFARVATARALDATGDGRPEVWSIGKARGRTVARLARWNGRKAHSLFDYNARRSPLGKRWKKTRFRWLQLADGAPAALELKVVETSKRGKRRVVYFKLKRGKYRRYSSAGTGPGDDETPEPDGPRADGGGYPVGPFAPPEPPLPPPSRFVAPGASDNGSCAASTPCGSLDAAIHAANAGELVQVAAGTYPVQILTPDSSRAPGSPVVLVRPAPGAQVRTGELRCGRYFGEFGADAVDIGDMTVNGVLAQRCDRLTLRRVTVDAGVFVNGSSNFSMVGGSVGPGVDYHPDIAAIYDVEPKIVPRNVVFDGVYFHDWTLATPGVHIECLQVSDVRGFALRNSHFHNCDTFDAHIDGTTSGPVEDVVVENNIFEPSLDHTGGSTPAYYSLSIRDGARVLIRNNASTQSFAWPAASQPISDWRVVNNVAPLDQYQCDNRIAYSHNLWTGARCGSSDRTGSLAFRDAGAFDYRPGAGSPAVNGGDSGDFPGNDARGRARPRGAAPDIGPFEEG
jgi:hypothetical protein